MAIRFAQPDSPQRQPSRSGTKTEDDPGILKTIGRKSLSGLSMAGDVLDTYLGGSSVRDILAGENPFDQLLDPFSPEKKTSGRQLLEEYDLLSPNQPGFDAGDVGGFLAEAAFDPATYLTFGASSALTGAGKAAKAAGKLTPGLRAGIEAGERGLFGLSVPFTKPTKVVGTGKTAQRVAGGLETAWDKARNNPASLGAAAIFSPAAKMRSTKFGQLAGKALHANEELGTADVRQFSGHVADRMSRAGLTDEAAGDALRQMIEGIDDAAIPELSRLGDDAAAELHSIADEITPRLKGLRTKARSFGMNDTELSDLFAEYFPRYRSRSINQGKRKTRQFVEGERVVRNPDEHNLSAFLRGDPSDIRRDEVLRDLGGGTGAIKRVAKDPAVNELIDRGIKSGDELNAAALAAGGPRMFQSLDPLDGVLKFDDKKLDRFSKWLANEPKEIREAGVFGNHPIVDLEARLQYAENRFRAAETFADEFAQQDYLRLGAEAAASGKETVPLYKLLNQMGMHAGHPEKGDKAILRMLEHNGIITRDPASKATVATLIAENADLIDKTRQGMLSHIAERLGVDVADETAEETIKQLRNAPVPADLAADFQRHTQANRRPEILNKMLNAVDSVTNFTKMSFTGLWPAFHVRNLTSGQVQNWLSGMWDAGSVRQGHKLIRGGVVDGAAKIPAVRQRLRDANRPLTDAEGTSMLRRMMYEHNVTYGHQGEVASRAGVVDVVETDPFAHFVGGLHGGNPAASAKRIGRKLVAREEGATLNPLDIRGWGGKTDTAFGPAAAGQEVGAYVEGMNRIPAFINQLKKGVDPTEAGRKVNAAQIDYSSRNFTPVEREYALRAFPFYKFSSRIMGHTLNQLAQRPGGRMAQTIRATNRLRDPGAVTPDHVQQGLAIPLGQEPDGSDRYITGAGLMHEDPFGFAGDGVQGALLEAGSRLNPIVKTPLEWMAGQSFFQRGPQGGRPLDKLDPPLGRTLSNVMGRDEPVQLPQSLEFALSNSPLSRLITTARTATDPRKRDLPGLMNLTTGLRVTDVSPASQDAILREHASALAKELGATDFARVYFPKRRLAEMSDDERIPAQQLQALLNELARRSKERAKSRERG